MNEQVYTFLLLAAAGAVLSLLFDCYRVTRNYLRLRWFGTAVGDLLYWLIATAVVFSALLKGNWGEIRFFAFLGLLSGAGLYFHFVSVYAAAIIGKTVRSIGKILQIIAAIINYIIVRPVILPVRWMTRYTAMVARRLYVWFTSDRNPPEE